MSDWITAALVVAGALLALIAAIGIVRMPDLYLRMHAAAKAGTLGVGLLLTASAVHFKQLDITVLVLLTVAFMVLTAPVAAHIIVRAAYYSGVPMSERSIVDDLKSRRDRPSPFKDAR